VDEALKLRRRNVMVRQIRRSIDFAICFPSILYNFVKVCFLALFLVKRKIKVNYAAVLFLCFRDLFFKAGKEKSDNIIDIPTIVNSTGFAKILDFVYTSQLCLSQSTVMQVLKFRK